MGRTIQTNETSLYFFGYIFFSSIFLGQTDFLQCSAQTLIDLSKVQLAQVTAAIADKLSIKHLSPLVQIFFKVSSEIRTGNVI